MLSLRLKNVADMVTPCDYIADIGTDHAYLPIYLIKKGVVKRAVAADISRGSCDKAQKNIAISGLENYIEVRCGNGLSVMAEDEIPDSIIIAGMGGMLAIEVLNSHKSGSRTQRLVLQVQKDIVALRRHLHSTGYKIVEERILKENGKIYTAMAAEKGEDVPYTTADYCYGKLLIEQKDSVLKELVAYELKKNRRVLSRIEGMNTEEINERRLRLISAVNMQEEVLKCLQNV